MAASTPVIWELKHARPGGRTLTAGRAKFWTKARKLALIGTQVLFALGAYSYVAWCVLK